MKIINRDELLVLIPEEGCVLKHEDGTYSDLVYLAINASPSEWKDVPQEEVENING